MMEIYNLKIALFGGFKLSMAQEDSIKFHISMGQKYEKKQKIFPSLIVINTYRTNKQIVISDHKKALTDGIEPSTFRLTAERSTN